MFNVSSWLILYAGFAHAFETDHLLAVSNMIISRNKTFAAVKDGMYWGLGHTSTILFMGILVLLLKLRVSPAYFMYFEAAVGGMLILLGIYRLQKKRVHAHAHLQTPAHVHGNIATPVLGTASFLPAYSIGLVHGLAGSGSLLLLVITQIHSAVQGLVYLLIFGVGSVAGMMLAAGLFSLPFSQKLLGSTRLQKILTWLSALLCVGYGSWIVIKNLSSI